MAIDWDRLMIIVRWLPFDGYLLMATVQCCLISAIQYLVGITYRSMATIWLDSQLASAYVGRRISEEN